GAGVEGVVVTLRASKNGRAPAERARDLLAGLATPVLGVVVNGVGKHGAMNGYGYEHYHYGSEYTDSYTTSEADGESADAADAGEQPEDAVVLRAEACANGQAGPPPAAASR